MIDTPLFKKFSRINLFIKFMTIIDEERVIRANRMEINIASLNLMPMKNFMIESDLRLYKNYG